MKKSPNNKAQIKPVGERVLVRRDEADSSEKTASGIYIPSTSEKEKPEQGKVIAIGDTKTIKVGDTVIFSKYGYDEVTINNEEYLLIKEENILAIIK